MSEHPHTTEGDIECSCNPLVLTVAADGSISRIAGGPLEEPIDTGSARSTPAEALPTDHRCVLNRNALIDALIGAELADESVADAVAAELADAYEEATRE